MSQAAGRSGDPFAGRALPAWFAGAKLGIFIHWGVYSVPGWAPMRKNLGDFVAARVAEGRVVNDVNDMLELFLEDARLREARNMGTSPYAEWYWNSLMNEGSPTAEHHKAHWGARSYESFAEDFREATRDWDPSSWADLFARAGARYVVVTTKHHDGFCLWPTRTPHPRLSGWSTKRDLVGDLGAALKAADIRLATYYSEGLDWSLKGLPMRRFTDMVDAIVQAPEEVAYMRAHLDEIVERFAPSLIWGDIAAPRDMDVHGFLKSYYERVPDGVVNDRFQTMAPGDRSRHADYATTEYFAPSEPFARKWEVCRGLARSFGYNRADDDRETISREALVALLADTAAHNGNLLLGVGPMADGTIPDLQRARLEELGAWLAVNGEAIFDTAPAAPHAARTAEGHEVRFTRRDGVLYAIVLGRTSGTVSLPRLDALAGPIRVSALGLGEVGHRAGASGLAVDLSRADDSTGTVIRIAPAGS
ncbi:MAG: alpha-L-fucosidase [Alphaproteobacteria bacterium]|nr:alpha-L-fucosidase [Alphaproteobacteria bacterium]